MRLVALILDPTLPAGSALFPPGGPTADCTLTLGSNTLAVQPLAGGSPGEVRIAPDVAAQLALPYSGIRLELRQVGETEIELGPAIAVIYPGTADSISARRMAGRADLYYGHLAERPGLFAFGFDESVDWQAGVMTGWVVDNRPGSPTRLIPASFPIPAAARLTWSMNREAVHRLRVRTGNRTFNWVRNIGKWQFHSILSGSRELASRLPETRLFRYPADLAAMLAKYETVFVKTAFGIRGQGTIEVKQRENGLRLSYLRFGQLGSRDFTDLETAAAHLRWILGEGRAVVQQGLPIVGQQNRALDFRVVTARNRQGEWYCPVITAKVAAAPDQCLTNVAAGATEIDGLEGLEQHHGMTRPEALDCLKAMTDLCLHGSPLLAKPFQPLGILGWDVAVDSTSHKLWLLEANSVPGWDYADPGVEAELARSQIDYALYLAGFDQ